MILEAPHPSIQTVTELPNPQLGETNVLAARLTVGRAEDGTPYTYVAPKNGERVIGWTFTMTRDKGRELRAFLESYHSSDIKITDHHGDIWIGKFITDGFDFETGTSEWQTIDLSFRARRV